MCDFWDEGVVWVGVGEHRADGEENYIKRMREWGYTFGDCEGRGPLITENVETDTTVRVDVGVIDSSCEIYLSVSRVRRGWKGRDYFWWFEGVVCWEMDSEEEDATGVWTITLEKKTQLVAIQGDGIWIVERIQGYIPVP